MLHSLFGSNRPFVLIILLVPALALATLAGVFLEVPDYEFGGPIFDWLLSYLGNKKWLLLTLGFLVNFVSAYILNAISNTHHFNRKENYFPALVFILMGSLNLSWWFLNPLSLGLLFLLLALRRLLHIYRVQEVTGKVFDAGIFVAMAALIYPPLVCAAPIVWLSLLQLRTFNFREWMVPITGILLPSIYVAAIFLWKGYLLDLSEFTAFQEWHVSNIYGDKPGLFYSFAIFSSIVMVMGSVTFITDMQVSTVHKKNTKKVMVWLGLLLGITLAVSLSLGPNVRGMILLAAIPAAVAYGDFFLISKRKNVIVAIFYVWVLFAFLYPLFASIF